MFLGNLAKHTGNHVVSRAKLCRVILGAKSFWTWGADPQDSPQEEQQRSERLMAQSASKGGMGDRQDGVVSSITTDGKIVVTRTEVQFFPLTKI